MSLLKFLSAPFSLSLFPMQVLRLTALTTLDISQGNQLLVLPPTLTILQQLVEMIADDNRLFYVHPELGKMATLQRLSLKNNVLETLPHELSAISTLKNLKYSGNPLTGPPEGTPVSIQSLEKILEEDPAGFEPWMDAVVKIAAVDVPPEATLVYLQNWIRARGSAPMKVKGTQNLDLRWDFLSAFSTSQYDRSSVCCLFANLFSNALFFAPSRALGLGHMPREVSDLEWSGLQHRHWDMTKLVHIRLDHNPIAELPTKIR